MTACIEIPAGGKNDNDTVCVHDTVCVEYMLSGSLYPKKNVPVTQTKRLSQPNRRKNPASVCPQSFTHMELSSSYVSTYEADTLRIPIWTYEREPKKNQIAVTFWCFPNRELSPNQLSTFRVRLCLGPLIAFQDRIIRWVS